jgi:zinc D-Ala-D-Ala dipeptidase
MKLIGCFLTLTITALTAQASQILDQPAEGFRDVTQVIPGIRVEARYNTGWNFYGARVPGYEANKCFLTGEAANALKKAQEIVAKQGYSLLAFDCYRPQRAVSAFVEWVKSAPDQKMKRFFYQEEDQRKLIANGYINSRSGHSRGSTIDLTLIKADTKSTDFRELETKDCRKPENIEATGQLDMGTTYDCFSHLSATESPKISGQARANRKILKDAMEAAGFENYKKEWWHYSLKSEPHPKTFFDFPVR